MNEVCYCWIRSFQALLVLILFHLQNTTSGSAHKLNANQNEIARRRALIFVPLYLLCCTWFACNSHFKNMNGEEWKMENFRAVDHASIFNVAQKLIKVKREERRGRELKSHEIWRRKLISTRFLRMTRNKPKEIIGFLVRIEEHFLTSCQHSSRKKNATCD